MHAAVKTNDPAVAQQLRLMAAEYMVQADQFGAAGAPMIDEAPAQPGIELPGPAAPEPTE